MCTAVIACCDTPPIFQSSKHIFDFMPLFIRGFGVSSRKVPALSRRYTGCYSFGFQSGAKFIAVIAFVAKQSRCTIRQCWIDQFCANMIAHLAFAQAHDDRATLTITNRMQFGVQATLCSPDRPGNIPFLGRLLAVR